MKLDGDVYVDEPLQEPVCPSKETDFPLLTGGRRSENFELQHYHKLR